MYLSRFQYIIPDTVSHKEALHEKWITVNKLSLNTDIIALHESKNTQIKYRTKSKAAIWAV